MSRENQEAQKSLKNENADTSSAMLAKLVDIDGSQAVLLPNEARFPEGTRIEIKKVGDFLVLSPTGLPSWSSFLQSLEQFRDLPPLERDQPNEAEERGDM